MPQNGHLNGSQAGGPKSGFWAPRMEFPGFPGFGLCRGRRGWGVKMHPNSRSPKAGHNRAGRSDFRDQRFEPDAGKMRKVPLTSEKQGSEEIPQSGRCGHENAENEENAADWL